MGLFFVGPFGIPRTRIIPPEEHICWGHAQPKENTGTQCACGYLAASYVGQQPPAPKVFSLDGNEECAQAFGIAPWIPVVMPPWNPVVMPNWSLRWREEQERRPELPYLDEHAIVWQSGH